MMLFHLTMAITVLFALCGVSAAQPVSRVTITNKVATIDVDDPRPLAQAIDQIERLSGRPITYEDAPLTNPNDLVDRTVPGLRKGQALDPRGGRLTFQCQQYSDPNALECVEAALRTYKTAVYPASYAVEEEGDILHVVPQEALDTAGRPKRVDSLLSVPLTISSAVRPIPQALRELRAALTKATGRPVLEGPIPLNILANLTVDLSAQDESGRSILIRILSLSPRPLSWRLAYDPGSRNYMLSIHAVARRAVER
jgi:hypothetical protein